jgi:hypothetical protein
MPAVILLSAALFMFSTGTALADAIVVTRAMLASTIAEIFVEDDAIRTEIEIGAADIEAFRNVMPDEIYSRMGLDGEPFELRLPRFLDEDWVTLADGSPIKGRVTDLQVRPRVERDRITGEPLLIEEDARTEPTIFVVIEYPLERKPLTLAFRPPLSQGGRAGANVGFVVYHKGINVNNFRYLSGRETLKLDWDDPWYSEFDNRNLRRQYYEAISVFLYIEPYEVRKELVLRPRDLEQWVDLGIGSKEVIPVSIQDDIKAKAAEFLGAQTPTTIDGAPVEGTLDRVHFIYRNLRTSGVISPPEDLEASSALLGVIWVYPTEGLPDSVMVDCNLFGGRIERIISNATDEAGGFPYYLTPDDHVLRWQNFLKNPTVPTLVDVAIPPRRSLAATVEVIAGTIGILVMAIVVMTKRRRGERLPRPALVALACAVIVVLIGLPRVVGPTRISEERAQMVVGDLLRNIYRAFDFRDEVVIYDTLARSASGEVLTEVYLQTRQSLELKNQGGARARVKQVEMISTEQEGLEGETGFVAKCTWRVSGSVLHWGHVHSRANQYAARFVVKAVEGAWKIAELELLEEIRIDPNTGEKLS